jgi:hypothetical protein
MAGYELPFQQCRLRNTKDQSLHDVAWLPGNGCRAGACVELKSDGTLWEVIEVYPGEMSADKFREHQKLNRNSLPSVRDQK